MNLITLTVPNNDPKALLAAAHFFSELAGDEVVLKLEMKESGGPTPTPSEETRSSSEPVNQDALDPATLFGGTPSTTDPVADTAPDSFIANDAPRDKANVPWDERIHSSNMKLTAQGVWQRKRNTPDAVFDAVMAELRGGAPIPAPLLPPSASTATEAPKTVEIKDIIDFIGANNIAIVTVNGLLAKFGGIKLTEANSQQLETLMSDLKELVK